GDEGEGDLNAGLAVGSGQAAGRAGQPGVQHARVGAPAVADTGQPGGQPFGREPVGAVLAGEAAQERQGDLRVDVGEQADRGGESDLQVSAQLVGQRHPGSDQVLAGPTGRAQGHRGRVVGGEGAQSPSVGAGGVGQYVGVEPVVFVA